MSGVAFILGIGWIISGIYFIANTVIENATGKSIGDHLGDALHNPTIQKSLSDMATMPSF